MTMTRSQPYSPLLDRTLKLALEYLDRLQQGPVGATSTLAELRQRLDRPLPLEGREPSAVIEQLVADAAGGAGVELVRQRVEPAGHGVGGERFGGHDSPPRSTK